MVFLFASCGHSFFSAFLLFYLDLFFVFHSSQKKTPQKTGHSKNPKDKNAQKTDKKIS